MLTARDGTALLNATGTFAIWLAAWLPGFALAACSNAPVIPAPSEVPLGKETLELLAKKGMQAGSPVFVRIFKEESELEIWKQRDDGRFYHFKTYPICNWSGELGPKQVQGDKQAPEGFYNNHADSDEPELEILSVLQRRLSERLRQVARPHRRLASWSTASAGPLDATL